MRVSVSPRKSKRQPCQDTPVPTRPRRQTKQGLHHHKYTLGPQRPRSTCPPAPTTAKSKNPTNARHKRTPECMMLRVPNSTNDQSHPTHSSREIQGSPMLTRSGRGPKSATRNFVRSVLCDFGLNIFQPRL